MTRATANKITIKTIKDITINRAMASTTGTTMTMGTTRATKAKKATKAINKTDTTMLVSKAIKMNTTTTSTTTKAATAPKVKDKVKVKHVGTDDAAAAEATILKRTQKHSPTSR